MSLSDIAITFSVSMTISYLHLELLALNIRMVTAKNSSQHLNPCMLMFSDLARHLLKSGHKIDFDIVAFFPHFNNARPNC